MTPAIQPASTREPILQPETDPVAFRAGKQHVNHSNATVLLAIQSLLYIIIVAVFIITFAAQPFRIPSESMEPTLLVGDFLLVDKSIEPTTERAGLDKQLVPATEPRRGDVIVFHYPVDPTMHLVKRVIGMPGDHLHLRQGQVFINGHALDEPYAVYRRSLPDGYRDNFPRLQQADPSVDTRWWMAMHKIVENGDLVVPEGNYFVLGDNRNDSEDSRYWGFVPRDAIVGKPLLIYFSLRPSTLAAISNATGLESVAEGGLPAQREPAHKDPLTAVTDFARWGRVLRVVR